MNIKKAIIILLILSFNSLFSNNDSLIFGNIDLANIIKERNYKINIYHVSNYNKEKIIIQGGDTFFIDKKKLKYDSEFKSYIVVNGKEYNYLDFKYRGQDFINLSFNEDSIADAWGHISFYYNKNKLEYDIQNLLILSKEYSVFKEYNINNDFSFIYNNSLFKNDKYYKKYISFITKIERYYR